MNIKVKINTCKMAEVGILSRNRRGWLGNHLFYFGPFPLRKIVPSKNSGFQSQS
jgi:hypothetical protein